MQFGVLWSSASAQNLVANPSFETYTACPTTYDQLNQAPPWSKPTGGSPDYFNACAGSPAIMGVPGNDLGNQVPNSGNGYAGFILRPSNPNYREYIQAQLTSPLVANVAYNVSFYVSLSDQSKWGVDKIGAYLSGVAMGPVNNALPLPLTPQVSNPLGNFITSKTTWTLVSGTYVAAGGENYIVIGNFYNDASTTPVAGLGGFYTGAYYYIDDVSVSTLNCEPLPDGSACTEAACADPNALCRPSKVIDNPSTGQTTVIECGCDCFMRRNDVPPFEPLFCTGGTCRATGRPCQLATTPVHGVGIMYDCCGACSQPPQACCLPSYQCVDDDPLCCTQQGGVPAGTGTSCTEPEACCYPDGSDDVQDPACCTIAGGSPQGPGSGTAEVRPAACCFPDGSCSELNPYCCDELSGTYLGLGIHCMNDTNGDGIDDACCVKGPFDDLTVIDLTTGWDDDANAPIPAGSPDDTWRAVPAASALVLDPTAVFSPSPSPWATLPPSQWISENANDISAHTDCYEACFCLNGEYANAVLSFSIYADNLARVYLNNPGCGLTATPLITTPNNAFTSPATFFTTTNHPKLKVGTNCVQVRVSSPGGPSAFTLLGQLTADNAQCCCEPQDVHVELTTGEDDGTLAPIQPGFDDDTWNVIWAPTPGPLPRPAVATIEPVNGQGGIQSWFTIPPSRWISTTVYGGANFSFPATEAPDGFYYYESCFCLNGGFKNAVLIGHIRSDDEARVTLNNCFVAATPVCTGTPPCSFNLPNPTAFIMTNPACFQPGRNCVRVDVEQKFGSVTGFTLAGYAAADDAKCCGGGDFAELDREACLTHGDIDCDGDTDLHDSAVLPGCLLGPGEGVSPGCDVVNLEVDADIDLRDASRIQNLFNRL